jgi:hypothetical protein
MGFLRKGSKRSNTNAPVDNVVDRAVIQKHKSILNLFGSSKKKENFEECILRTAPSKMIFQHTFMTVDGEEIANPNNVTVDSIETIMVATVEEGEKEEENGVYPQQPLAISVIDNVAHTVVDERQKRGVQFWNKEEEFPDDELLPIGNQTVNEQEWQQEDHHGDEKKEEMEILQSGETQVRYIDECDSDDDEDESTDNNPTMDSVTGLQSSLQTDSPSKDNQNPMELAAGAFVQVLGCTAQDVRNFASLPKSLGGIARPAMACQPIINQHATAVANGQPERASPTEFYDEDFALKFLNVR